MSKTNLTEKFWQEFCAENPDVNLDEPYQVWYFGNTSEMSKELVALVLQGKKTATASLFWEYESKPEDEPMVDGYSVVTDFEGNPMCVLRACLKSHSRVQSSDHQTNHCRINHRFRCFA